MSLLLRQIIHHVNYILYLSSITSSHPLAYTIVFSFGFDFTNFLGNFPALFGIECCPKCLQRRFWKVYQTVLTESMPWRLGFRSQTRGMILPYLTLFRYYGSFLCCWFIFLKRIRANRNSLFLGVGLQIWPKVVCETWRKVLHFSSEGWQFLGNIKNCSIIINKSKR